MFLSVKSKPNTLNASIGQSTNSFTPIQLANYISAIANGGTLNKVSIIKEIKNEQNGNEVSLDEIDKYASEKTGVNFASKNIGLEENYVKAIKEGIKIMFCNNKVININKKPFVNPIREIEIAIV